MTNPDLASFSAWIALFFIFAAVLVLALVNHRPHTADYPADDDFEHQVRLVELENGIYSIQVWRYGHEWEAPFGHHQFHTLDEAKADKERRIEELKREAGYRFKRVVD